MHGIKNIIFDFGNVLFDLELGAISRDLQQLSGGQFEQVKADLLNSGILELYETGGLSSEEFIDKLSNFFDPPLSPEQVRSAWNAIFVGNSREWFERVLELKQHYKVFLLSNINDLHARWIDDYMEREHDMRNFQMKYFDAVYYSHLIQMRKPNRDIYEFVLADAGILPEETVFIDDLEVNIEAAQALGIHVIHKTPDLDIMQLMGNFLEYAKTGVTNDE